MNFMTKPHEWVFNMLRDLVALCPSDPQKALDQIGCFDKKKGDTRYYPNQVSLFDRMIIETGRKLMGDNMEPIVQHLSVTCFIAAHHCKLSTKSARKASLAQIEGLGISKHLEIGQRILNLAFSITPHSPLGVLLLPYMGVTMQTIEYISEEVLILFCKVFTCRGGDHPTDNLASLGFKNKSHLAVLGAIKEKYMPALEHAFAERFKVENYHGLSKDLKKLVVKDTTSGNPYSFGFQMDGRQLWLPSHLQIDDEFPGRAPSTRSTITLFNKAIQVDRGFHLSRQGRFKDHDNTLKNTLEYQAYWNLSSTPKW